MSATTRPNQTESCVTMEERERNWEDLNTDCLANIFERVGAGALVLDVPLVCKSWYQASLDPQCWKVLEFMSVIDHRSENDFRKQFVPSFKLVKFMVDRSQGMATKVVLGKFWRGMEHEFEHIMHYISEGCPELRTLILPEQHQLLGISRELMKCIPKLIKKWKHLQYLEMHNNYYFKEVISQIATHCKKFDALSTGRYVEYETVLAIVTLLPNIKCLELRRSDIARRSLMFILCRCKSLEVLDVRDCVGFDADDAEISMMASHIKGFISQGSTVACLEDLVDYYVYYSI